VIVDTFSQDYVMIRRQTYRKEREGKERKGKKMGDAVELEGV